MTKVSELVSQNVGNAIINFQTWGGIIYNVKAYGAKGNGTTDDTVAIQAAINAASAAGGGVVFFPAGLYLTSATLNITTAYVKLEGAGRYTSMIQRANATGDTVYFNGDGLYGCGMSHMTMNQITNEMTSGAHLKIRGCIDGSFYDLGIISGYDGISILGSARLNFYDIWGSHQLGLNGHNMYQIIKDATLTQVPIPTSLKFSQCDCLELNTGKAYSTGWYINASDGIQFNSCHAQGAKTSSLYIDGTNATKLLGLMFSNCYFDDNGFRCVTIAGTATSNFGNFLFSNCIFRVSVGTQMFDISGNVNGIIFTGCYFSESTHYALVIGGVAGGIKIGDCQFAYNNSSNTTTSFDIVINAGALEISVTGCQFRRATANGGAINLAAGATDKIIITDNDFTDMPNVGAAKIVDSGITGTNVLYANNMGHTPAPVASAATIAPSTGEAFHVTGTTNITDMNIRPAGTRVFLIFDGTLSVLTGANKLKLRANFAASSNYCLSLVSDGVNWLQIGT